MSTKTTAAQTIKDVMTANPIRVSGDTTAREFARILDANEISGVPVVDALDRVIGVVSKTDLLHRCVEGPAGSTSGTFFEALAEARSAELEADDLGTVEEFMTPEPVVASGDDAIAGTARRMAQEGVHRVIVIDDQRRVLGIVTPPPGTIMQSVSGRSCIISIAYVPTPQIKGNSAGPTKNPPDFWACS